MMNIEVAPVAAIASDAAMAIALRYCGLALQTDLLLFLPLIYWW